MRSAEEECGIRNSTRGGVRKRNAGSGTRPEAGCGKGMRNPELGPRRSSEKEWGDRVKRRPSVAPALRRTSCTRALPNPAYQLPNPASVSSSAFRIPLPHSASPRAPHPAFLFRTPPRLDLRIPHSFSAPRLASSSASRIPLPHPASGRVPHPAFLFRTPPRVGISPLPSVLPAPLRSKATPLPRTRGTSPARSPRDRPPGCPAAAPPPRAVP